MNTLAKKNGFILIATALFLVGGFFVATPASADSVSTDFESYNTEISINDQDGWVNRSTSGFADACALYDQKFDGSFSTTGFGSQSLRISNAVTSGCFGDQTFSKSLTDAVGETGATAGGFPVGTLQPHFEMQFDIASKTPEVEQTDLFMSVSPDRGDGSRMSYLGFIDTDAGIQVVFYDMSGTGPVAQNFTDLGTFSRSTPHTVKLTIDVLDGASNDVVKVWIDGVLEHEGTSWENLFYFGAGQGTAPRAIRNVLFRSGRSSNLGEGNSVAGNLNNGFLIDNLSLLSGSIPEVPTPTGSIQITKYGCTEGTTVLRSANGVDGSVPETCELQNGATFGYVHGEASGTEGPYPELDADITEAGATVDGVLTINDLPATGRYLVMETDGEGNKLTYGEEVIGLYCEGDGDTSDSNDNQELTFVPEDGTAHCVAYNIVTPPASCDADVTNTYNSDESTLANDVNSFLITPHNSWALISGVSWIWDALIDGNVDDSPVSDVTFTKDFSITGAPISATLEISADNGYVVSVNGADLSAVTGCSSVDDNTWNSIHTCEIPVGNLVVGSNTLEIIATNAPAPEGYDGPNPGGLTYKLNVVEACVAETPATYELNYTAGAGGTISGDASQTVNAGTDGTPVTAIANTGFTFIGWSGTDSSTDNPRTDLAVSGNISVLANFVADAPAESIPEIQPTDNGGGGGNSSSGSVPNNDGGDLGAPGVLGAQTENIEEIAGTCSVAYMTDFLSLGAKNNPEQVKLLQTFLNQNLGIKLAVDGVFGPKVKEAVKAFQVKYSSEVLVPWKSFGVLPDIGTGIVYKTTLRWINMLNCPDLKLPMPLLP